MVDQDLESAPRELVVALDRLIAVGGRADSHQIAGPRRAPQFAPQHLDDVGLDQDHRRELVVGIHLELLVVLARVAVVAAMGAAAVGVQGPVEGHAVGAVHGRPAHHFLVARLIGAAVGLGQCFGPTRPHHICDVSHRWRFAPEGELSRPFHV
jgi:hypothetical protein